MFTANDYALVRKNKFHVMNETVFYVEIISPRTKHCWIIYKHGSPDSYPVWLYHKHKKTDQCYHLHKKTRSVYSAVREIHSHDQYQLNGRKRIFDNFC